MKNATNAMKREIEAFNPLLLQVEVTLANSRQLTLTADNDIMISGNKIDSTTNGGFPIGDATCRSVTISFDNSDRRYSGIDFYGATVVVYTIATDLDAIHNILEGTFYVIDTITPSDIIELTAYDAMVKTDVPFTSELTYPTAAQNLFNEVCEACGILSANRDSDFTNKTFQVYNAPENCTGREVLGYIAMIAGGNAIVTPDNKVKIKSYNRSAIDLISGGALGDSLIDKIDAGTLDDEIVDYVQGGNVTDNVAYILLENYASNPEIGTDAITITGVYATSTEGGTTTTYQSGTMDYPIKVDNPLIAGNEQTAVEDIAAILVGLQIRPFSGSFTPNPLAEFMDIVVIIDRYNTLYVSIAGEVTFNYLGTTDISNNTPSPERNKAVYR